MTKNLFTILFFCSLLCCNYGCHKTATIVEGVPIGTTRGCDDILVYQVVEKDVVVGVHIDYRKIKFSTDWQTIDDFATETVGEAWATQTSDMVTLWKNTCNDAIYPISNEQKWTLTKGKVTFKVDKVIAVYGENYSYNTTVTLENADFQLKNSTTTKHYKKITFNNVAVGWTPG
jgi:hypothetical protein